MRSHSNKRGHLGHSGCSVDQRAHLNDLIVASSVAPISVDCTDPFYNQFNVTCLNFVKAQKLNEDCQLREAGFVSSFHWWKPNIILSNAILFIVKSNNISWGSRCSLCQTNFRRKDIHQRCEWKYCTQWVSHSSCSWSKILSTLGIVFSRLLFLPLTQFDRTRITSKMLQPSWIRGIPKGTRHKYCFVSTDVLWLHARSFSGR